MAGSKAMKGEIVSTGQENPLGVASELPVQDYPTDGSRGKQKVRASEVVIIILLVLLVLCCCCACIATAGILNAIVSGLGGLFGGGLLPAPMVY
jgi:hypothetical protein